MTKIISLKHQTTQTNKKPYVDITIKEDVSMVFQGKKVLRVKIDVIIGTLKSALNYLNLGIKRKKVAGVQRTTAKIFIPIYVRTL